MVRVPTNLDVYLRVICSGGAACHAFGGLAETGILRVPSIVHQYGKQEHSRGCQDSKKSEPELLSPMELELVQGLCLLMEQFRHSLSSRLLNVRP